MRPYKWMLTLDDGEVQDGMVIGPDMLAVFKEFLASATVGFKAFDLFAMYNEEAMPAIVYEKDGRMEIRFFKEGDGQMDAEGTHDEIESFHSARINDGSLKAVILPNSIHFCPSLAA